MMSELAFNLNGEPFEVPSAAFGWRVRRLKPKEASERAREAQRAEAAVATRRRRFDEAIAAGKINGKVFTGIALDHQRALVHAETCTMGDE
jgi:hypothetical protein